MPKKVDGTYKVDIRPAGRDGPRFRKSFDTQGEALAYEKYIIAENKDAKPWETQKPDNRHLSDLIEQWHKLHGAQLKSGDSRKTYLINLAEIMKDPIASTITAKTFSGIRSQRLKDGASPNTVNHDLAYLKSLFNELRRLGEWKHGNPFAEIRRLRMDEIELSYLEIEQIKTLLDTLDSNKQSHARITARVCLSTGARWGEAATLKPSQIRNGIVTFTSTKNGKNRSVPISEELQKLILDHAPLVDGYNTFKRAIKALDFNLPKGQLSHVLRHTFASYFMINGGNIITLQRVLGHGSITMTMRYAHLSPDHLNEVLQLNPLTI